MRTPARAQPAPPPADSRRAPRYASGTVTADLPLPIDVRLMQATASGLMALAVGLLLVLGVTALVRQPAFALRSIRVEGEVARSSEAQIRASALPRLSGSFFTADLGAVRRAFESVPWVRRAEVRRIWPNQLVVRLEEHRVAAVWNDEAAGDRLVDTAGDVFEANLGDIDDDAVLPELAGPDGSTARVLSMLHRLVPVLAPDGARIDRLALSGRGSWRAELDGGAVVELGRGSDDEVVARAAQFAATLPQVTRHYQRRLQYADLRHHDGYAVRLVGITTTEPAASAPRVGASPARLPAKKKH